MTTFGDMVYQFGGMPVGGMRFTTPWAKHYFVDGTYGSDSDIGTSPDRAVATIQQACTMALSQDVIYVRPKVYTIGTGFARYTEDIVVALGGAGGSAATATRAGVSLIGVTPKGKPNDHAGVRLKFTTATPITIDAPAFHMEGIGIFAEDATHAIHLRNNGATWTRMGTTGFSIYNCEIKGQFLYAEGSDEIQVINCRFQAKYDGTVAGINLVGSSNQVKRPLIQNCEFFGGNANNMSDACIVMLAPCYDVIIRDCYFNADSDTGIYVTISGSGNTGIISNCHFGVADVSTGRIVEGGIIGTGIYDGGGLSTAT